MFLARRVFFSFHFDNDAWRANQIRHSWITKPDRESAGFFDAADQEELKRSSKEKVRRWIDSQLQHTSVTAVLIGEETANREHVQYEIEKSFERGNALLGIRVHNQKDKHGMTGFKGPNPLEDYAVETGSGQVPLSEIFPTYNWKMDNGKENLGDWVEEAYKTGQQIPADQRNNLVESEDVSISEVIEGLAALGLILLALKFAADQLQKLVESMQNNQFR